MKHYYLLLFLFLPLWLVAGDSTALASTQQKKLKGYRKLFYQLILLHPKLNSPLEKELLRHYLEGSGETFILSDADFKLMQQAVISYGHDAICKPVGGGQMLYCVKQVNLIEEDYFGWAVGSIIVICTVAEKKMVSMADYYDFNKKKKGQRKFKNEVTTGIFRLITPSGARSFIVTYNAEAYSVRN